MPRSSAPVGGGKLAARAWVPYVRRRDRDRRQTELVGGGAVPDDRARRFADVAPGCVRRRPVRICAESAVAEGACHPEAGERGPLFATPNPSVQACRLGRKIAPGAGAFNLVPEVP